jgi:chemotaxis response regulator CheB
LRDGIERTLAEFEALRNAGHHTIAQDQSSSAVYGMPKAAAELNAAAEILALEAIPNSLLRRFDSNPNRC